MDYSIRKLNKEDFKGFVQLINKFRAIGKTLSKEEFDTIYDEIFSSGFIFVIKKNNKLIGSLKIVLERKFFHKCAIYAHIEDVIVDPDFRGQKLGVSLVKYAIDFCKKNNYYKIKLNCDENLVKFYEKNNFVESGVDMTFKI